jgi:LysR family transcriptional regulator, regulator for genes of the gallate degradation pathway
MLSIERCATVAGMPHQITADDLLLILAIAEAGTLAGAADTLFTAPPSVSRSLRAVEQRVGAPVFTRHRRGIATTPVGDALLVHARAIRAAGEQANRDATTTAAATARPELVVGIATKVSVASAANAVEAARAAGPTTRIILHVSSQGALLNALDNSEIDIMIGTIPTPSVHRIVEPLFEDRPVICCRDGHHLSNRVRVGVADLAHEQWVLPPATDPLHQRLSGLFADHGMMPPDPAVVTDDLVLAGTLVVTSDLVTVMPANAVVPQFGKSPLRVLSIDLTGRNDEIGVIRRRGEPSDLAAEAFIGALRISAGAPTLATIRNLSGSPAAAARESTQPQLERRRRT